MLRSPVHPSLARRLGDLSLGHGQPTGAILASMAAVTTAWVAHAALGLVPE